MAGISYQNSCYGFCPKGWKKATFSETLAGISTLTQWIPCVTPIFSHAISSRKHYLVRAAAILCILD